MFRLSRQTFLLTFPFRQENEWNHYHCFWRRKIPLKIMSGLNTKWCIEMLLIDARSNYIAKTLHRKPTITLGQRRRDKDTQWQWSVNNSLNDAMCCLCERQRVSWVALGCWLRAERQGSLTVWSVLCWGITVILSKSMEGGVETRGPLPSVRRARLSILLMAPKKTHFSPHCYT